MCNLRAHFFTVSPEAGCFEPFVSSKSTLSKDSLDRFCPRFSNDVLDHVVSKNPSCRVSLRTFQFYPVLVVDGSYSAELSTNGHGPVCLTTREFIESEVNNVDSSLDFCFSHLCWNQEANSAWAYALMIPAWLAVYTSPTSCCFFKSDTDQIASVSLDNCRTRFVFFFKFAFWSTDDKKNRARDDMINDKAKVMFTLEHNTVFDKWTLISRVLSGFD